MAHLIRELATVFDRRTDPGAVPIVSVAVIDGSDVTALAWGTDKETLFQAASVSKSVAAVVALALVARGELDLDGAVNGYLQSWRLPARRRQRNEVTVRHLLCHGGGITVSAFAGYRAGAPLPTLPDMLEGRPPSNSAPVRVSGKPGRKHWYSSGGYLLLQQVIEDVTGDAFADLAGELVLEPAGMANATYAPGTANRLAPPYVDGAPAVHGPLTYPEHAAAGLWCTPTDIVRFARAVQRSAAGEPAGLLPADLAKQMVTPHLDGWGLGVLVDDESARFGCVGRTEGYVSEYQALVRGARAAAAMASSDRGKPVVRALMEVSMTAAKAVEHSGR